MPISIIVNGSDVELPRSISILTYLRSKGLAERRIAVAYNGDVLAREKFEATLISQGDVIEIVRPVGGG